jgi:hypothetical protein
MSAAFGYSVGFREGHREGYVRGKAVARHISAKKVK